MIKDYSGDLGASIAPQLLGVVVDQISASHIAGEADAALQLAAEQAGLKAGMLVTAVFPLMGMFLVLAAIRYFRIGKKGKEKIEV